MTSGKPKKRRGRPPLKSGAPKRASFNTRLRDETKQQLEAEAEKAGRSLSEEIEARLEQSFQDEDAIVSFCGDRETVALMRAVLFAKDIVEGETGKSMHKDYETNIAAKYAMSAVLTYLVGRKKPEKSADYVQRERAFGKAIKRAEEEYEKRTGKKISNWLAVLDGTHEGFLAVPPNPEIAALKRGEALAKSLFGKLSEGVGKDPREEISIPVDTED